MPQTTNSPSSSAHHFLETRRLENSAHNARGREAHDLYTKAGREYSRNQSYTKAGYCYQRAADCNGISSSSTLTAWRSSAHCFTLSKHHLRAAHAWKKVAELSAQTDLTRYHAYLRAALHAVKEKRWRLSSHCYREAAKFIGQSMEDYGVAKTKYTLVFLDGDDKHHPLDILLAASRIAEDNSEFIFAAENSLLAARLCLPSGSIQAADLFLKTARLFLKTSIANERPAFEIRAAHAFEQAASLYTKNNFEVEAIEALQDAAHYYKKDINTPIDKVLSCLSAARDMATRRELHAVATQCNEKLLKVMPDTMLYSFNKAHAYLKQADLLVKKFKSPSSVPDKTIIYDAYRLATDKMLACSESQKALEAINQAIAYAPTIEKGFEAYRLSFQLGFETGCAVEALITDFMFFANRHPNTLEDAHMLVIEFAKSIQMNGQVASHSDQLAALYSHQGDCCSAASHYRQAADFYWRLGEQKSAAYSFEQAGKEYVKAHNFVNGMELIFKAIELNKSINLDNSVAMSFEYLAEKIVDHVPGIEGVVFRTRADRLDKKRAYYHRAAKHFAQAKIWLSAVQAMDKTIEIALERNPESSRITIYEKEQAEYIQEAQREEERRSAPTLFGSQNRKRGGEHLAHQEGPSKLRR